MTSGDAGALASQALLSSDLGRGWDQQSPVVTAGAAAGDAGVLAVPDAGPLDPPGRLAGFLCRVAVPDGAEWAAAMTETWAKRIVCVAAGGVEVLSVHRFGGGQPTTGVPYPAGEDAAVVALLRRWLGLDARPPAALSAPHVWLRMWAARVADLPADAGWDAVLEAAAGLAVFAGRRPPTGREAVQVLAMSGTHPDYGWAAVWEQRHDLGLDDSDGWHDLGSFAQVHGAAPLDRFGLPGDPLLRAEFGAVWADLHTNVCLP